MEFLMALQKREYQRAHQVWRDLAKRTPNDPTIVGFASVLPQEAKAQADAENDEEPESEYDEEADYDEEEEKSDESDEEDVEEEEKVDEE